jgi:hypothetical protein
MKVPPSGGNPTSTSVLRTVGATVAALIAIASVIALIVGIDSRGLRLTVLLLASATIAVVVVLLPTTWRARSALLATAFLTAAGFLPILTINSEEPPRKVNAQYLADLIRKGPFTEPLPSGFVAGQLVDVGIADPSAARRLDAVRLLITASLEGVGANGYIETYGSREEAVIRARARLDGLKTQYGDFGGSQGTAESFCVEGNGEWICGGYRGLVYAEASVHPAANAFLPRASGTVSAELRYADRMTTLAST